VNSTYKILVGKPERKGPVGSPRCRWEDNIRMDLRETWWEGVDWMHLSENRDQGQALVNTVMKLWVPF
jgi:hypothetical protein